MPNYDQPVGGGTFHDLTGGRDPVIPMVKEKIREGIATGQVVIESGMAVNTLEGSIGKVDLVISDRVSGKITHFCIELHITAGASPIVLLSSHQPKSGRSLSLNNFQSDPLAHLSSASA